MLPDRTKRMQNLNNPRKRWEGLGRVPKIKLGDDTKTFIAADTDRFIQAKTEAVGFVYTPDGASINPGSSLRHNIDAPKVSYNGLGFHIFSTSQPSTAVLPYPTFINQIVDPDSKALANVYNILQSLAGIVGL